MISPEGDLNFHVEKFRTMLGDAPEFQTWTDTPDAARALLRIHYEKPPPPKNKESYTHEELEAMRPFAVVYTADTGGFLWTLDSVDTIQQEGTIILELEQTAKESSGSDPDAEALMDWSNAIGLIAESLRDLRVGLSSEHLMFIRMRLMWRGWATKDQAVTQGLFQRAIIAIDF
jgi:hypothetical protein